MASRESELALGLTAASDEATVDYFNYRHPLHVIKERVALGTRRRMYRRVLELARPTREMRIVDVGTTPDLQLAYNNFFERWYPHVDRVAACSIEDCTNLERSFPGLTFKRIEGHNLPYENQQFDLALSFAVLEHVGSAENQRHYLSELARVARSFIVYTPYRYFPVEMHTFLPLLHWLPVRQHRAILRSLGMTFWAEEKNLNLVSVRSVRRLLPLGGQADVRLVWTLGWPSNIEIDWRRNDGSR
jgi:hypothetical protein